MYVLTSLPVSLLLKLAEIHFESIIIHFLKARNRDSVEKEPTVVWDLDVIGQAFVSNTEK